LYGGKNKEWQATALWTAFKENQPITTQQETETEPLQALFKI